MTPFVEELTPVPAPVQCCERLEGLPYRLFLDSAASTTRLGRYSFLMADPIAVIQSTGAGDALDAVRARLAPHTADPVSGLPPFQGGVAGLFSYDLGRSLEQIPACRFDEFQAPAASVDQ